MGKPVAIGCHVFAGGFTMGVRQHFKVPVQLERHNFGVETVQANLKGTEFINEDDFQSWHDHKDKWKDARFVFGNPRCTGFSLVTSGHDETIHGPWAKCTQDIHELCKFGIKADLDLICWESVQQAWTIGRPLLTYLKDEYFKPAGYRVAHLFLNASSFGNAQQRKRYFFVAYRDDKNFNVETPVLPSRQKLVKDVLGPRMKRKTRPVAQNSVEYDADCYVPVTPNEQKVIPHMPEGWDINNMGRHAYDVLKEHCPPYAQRWDRRCSDMPFSMHGPLMLRWEWNSPTMFSSCVRHIHPKLIRPITVGEAAEMMGWPDGMIPRGRDPFPQIVKGICPEVGEWLARQALLYLDNSWGKDDWDCQWNDKAQRWEGYDYTNAQVKPDEKVMDLNRFVPYFPERERALKLKRGEEVLDDASVSV